MSTGLIYTLVALGLIALEMIPEGLRLRAKHKWAASIEFLYRAAVAFILFAWLGGLYSPELATKFPFWMVLTGYVLLRYSVADLIHNLAAKLPLLYIGNTKWYDVLYNKFLAWTKFPDRAWLATTKFISGLVGLSMLGGWN
jgi:hypothetical protein